jgi:hypothetical protein
MTSAAYRKPVMRATREEKKSGGEVERHVLAVPVDGRGGSGHILSANGSLDPKDTVQLLTQVDISYDEPDESKDAQ